MPAIAGCTLFPLSKVKEHLFVFLEGLLTDQEGVGHG